MGTRNLNYDELEFCSECGEFVESLNEVTGWCDSCSKQSGLVAPTCPHCGNESSDGRVCNRCKYIGWLERNADEIERVMANGTCSYADAKKTVKQQNRPVCFSCGNPIKGGTKGRSLFCLKNPECRKAHNSYEYHHRTKPHSEALELAITASLIYKLTAKISR